MKNVRITLSIVFVMVFNFTGICQKPTPKIIKDIDGNVYPITQIGEQVWMAKNLVVTKYNDGTKIPVVPENVKWENCFTNNLPAMCYFNNDTSNRSVYGALYNWSCVDSKKLCPVGWRIPTKTDWEILTKNIGGLSTAAFMLKEPGEKKHWDTTYAKNSKNTFGFSGIPAGNRSDRGYFDYFGNSAYWWSSTLQDDERFVWYYSITSYYDKGILDIGVKYGFSVRCIKQ